MSHDRAPDFEPCDLRSETDVGHPDADSIGFVTVPGEDKVFLYLWDTEADEGVTSVVGFTADGVNDLQKWLTNVDIEARALDHSEYGGERP